MITETFVIKFEKLTGKTGVYNWYSSEHGAKSVFGKLAKKIGYEFKSLTLERIESEF
mgnify:CR=1 FL=1